MWKFIKTSDKYKYVSYQMDKKGNYWWMGRVLGSGNAYALEKDAALFVDKRLISKGKEPINVLKRKV